MGVVNRNGHGGSESRGGGMEEKGGGMMEFDIEGLDFNTGKIRRQIRMGKEWGICI